MAEQRPQDIRRIQEVLRSPKFMNSRVIERVLHLQERGYSVERLRHNGARVGDIYKLKSGELRIAIDAPRGKYRTAWVILIPPFGNVKYYC